MNRFKNPVFFTNFENWEEYDNYFDNLFRINKYQSLTNDKTKDNYYAYFTDHKQIEEKCRMKTNLKTFPFSNDLELRQEMRRVNAGIIEMCDSYNHVYQSVIKSQDECLSVNKEELLNEMVEFVNVFNNHNYRDYIPMLAVLHIDEPDTNPHIHLVVII